MIPRKQVRTKQRKMLVVKRIKWNVNKQFFSKKPLLNTETRWNRKRNPVLTEL